MKKFERLNKQTNTKESYIGCQGTLVTIDDNSRPNKVSGKKYYRFTAKLDTPSGEVLVGGQVYEALIPHLGKMPAVGDRLDFNCLIADLKDAQTNARWGIGGQAVDSVDSILDAIKDL